MSNGWIKIHRSLLEWEWYDDANVFRLFMHSLIIANHKDKKYRGRVISKGSFLTSRELLSMQTGLSEQQIRTALKKLKSTNELTIKTTSQGTEIQVVNYNKYQTSTNEATNEQPTNNQQVTTNKNIKNINNNKGEFFLVDIEECPDGVKPLYFHLAKSYHKLLLKAHPVKSIKEAKLDEWVKTIRLLIEKDNRSIEQLIGIKYYWELGLKKEPHVNDFWISNVMSIKALRKKDRDGVSYFDKIILPIKKYRNPIFEKEIKERTKNLKQIVNGH